jgi:uncharacterized protein DUF4124
MSNRTLFLLAAALAAAPLGAHAQKMYKCVDAKGKVYYTQLPPPECAGRATDELGKSGAVIKHNEAPLTAAQRAKIEADKEAEKKRKAEEAERLKEQQRQSTALLNTYSSVKDIDDARARALKDNQDAIKEQEKRYGAALARQQELDKEKAFYVNRVLPRKLQLDLEAAALDIKNQEQALDARRQEAHKINAKYDDEKRRYIELTAAKAPAPPRIVR